jgi:preprotein translocase subunit SecG
MLYTVLIVFHVVLAAALIAIVLVQRGPGATMGAAFGAGASGTVFGSRGSASFLTRATSWLGVAFFAISLSMAVIVARSGGAVVSADDLGVAGAVQTIPTAEQVEQGEEEFLLFPAEEESDEEFTEEDEFIPEPPEN